MVHLFFIPNQGFKEKVFDSSALSNTAARIINGMGCTGVVDS